MTSSALAQARRDLIVTLAARHKLPVVYFQRIFVTGGGLISYGADVVDQYRRAAGYVDRILKGEKPADLPVQAPTKYELVINLKTAKEFGLTVQLFATKPRRTRSSSKSPMSAFDPKRTFAAGRLCAISHSPPVAKC